MRNGATMAYREYWHYLSEGKEYRFLGTDMKSIDYLGFLCNNIIILDSFSDRHGVFQCAEQ